MHIKGSCDCSFTAVVKYLPLTGFLLTDENLQLHVELSLTCPLKEAALEKRDGSLLR